MAAYDPRCLHGGPLPSDAQKILEKLPEVCGRAGTCPALKFDPLALREDVDRDKDLGTGCAASVALGVAVDAFCQDDFQASRLFFRVSVGLAALAKMFWEMTPIWKTTSKCSFS